MERLTTNKSVADMSMIELAHNSCYADDERNARYRDYNLDVDSRWLVRNLAKDICGEDFKDLSDEEVDEYMDSMLSVGIDSTIGLLALFYRNLWAMADLREKLKYYEDAEEQGLLLRLPCKEAYSQSGDNAYLIYEDEIVECVHCGLSIDPVIGKGVIALATDEDIFPYRNPDPEHDLDPTDWCNNATDIEVREIGNTLFFTREEAEAKLKEMEGESDVL